LIKLYQSPEYAENALLTVKQEWERELGGISVRTPDRALDILMNGWLRYQVLACRIRARAAFYQCGGAYGFRDQLQDVLAFLDGNPELARRQILLCSSRQFIDGDVQHWWHPPTGAGVRTLISDDLLWLPYVTAEYAAQTGDLSILTEQVPYLDGESLQNGQHEIMFTPQESTQRDTVYRHCLAAINHACRFGRNGLPLMGGGDWNDGMNAVGIGGSGESVWLGWFLYSILHTFIQICRQMDDPVESRHMASIAANLLSNLENKAWDGMWYLRGFFDNGHPLGSKANDECQIDSISQSWAILSGAANRKKAEKALDSADYYLVHDDSRAIQLLTPPFNQSADNPGYIRGYYPGVRENGGQYTHAAVWLAMAAAKLKKTTEAWRLLNLLNPIRSTQDTASANLYEKEPYVMSADICMAEPYKGRAGWSWYTGSAGWMYQAVLKTFLGINRQNSRLIIDPCIPFSWKGYQADYQIGRTLYQITIQNKNGDGATVQSMTVDGVPADGNSFELIDDGGRHQVVVRLNERKQRKVSGNPS